jgi:two-component system response regulator AtoC
VRLLQGPRAHESMIELDFSRFLVLVVDDEQDNLDAFRFVFRKSFSLRYAQGGQEALALLEELDPAVIVTDQRMPTMSGIELLRRATHRRPDAVGVLLTAYTDMPVLLEAINSGAVYRYVQKPWDSKELTVILRQSIERFYHQRENVRLRDQLARYTGYLEAEQQDPLDFGDLSTQSPTMKEAVLALEKLAPSDEPVLVTGEVGTEKELFARALHVGSPREGKPYVQVSAAAFSPEGLERELFGWARGAFAGAALERAGRLELAHGGTLVLTEVGELPAAVKERLLRYHADGVVQRLGSEATVSTDVRILATKTLRSGSVAHEAALGSALAKAVIAVPPLRERVPDLPQMSQRLLVKFAKRYDRPATVFGAEASARLAAYPWPGNVGELSCVVERAVLLCPSAVIGAEHVAPGLDAGGGSAASETSAPEKRKPIDLPTQLDEMERRELCSALERCSGNKAEVARMLGIQRTTLYYRLKRLGIDV